VTRLHDALERAKATEGTPSMPPLMPASLTAETEPDGWNFEQTSASAPGAAPVEDHPQTARDTELDTITPIAERFSGSDKIVVVPGADVTLVEQFRRLAAALHHQKTQNGASTVMIASAVENEGKTLTATNLALTLSESYQRRVLLIDADLRRPSVHRIFNIDNRYGLSDTLKHVVPDGKLPLHRLSANLWVVPGGTPDPDPMSGLTSETMHQLLAEAVEQFDWVVIDTPPVVLLPDANLLAAMIDTALLVVRANSTPYPLSARAVEAIGQDRLLGVVLNRARDNDLGNGGYYYSHYRYSYSYGKPKEEHRTLLQRLLPWRKK